MAGVLGLWTLPAEYGQLDTAFVVLSFESATRVLGVGGQEGEGTFLGIVILCKFLQRGGIVLGRDAVCTIHLPAFGI